MNVCAGGVEGSLLEIVDFLAELKRQSKKVLFVAHYCCGLD